MDTKPIPAFYCCYLLRSTVQRGFNYIGSTPNMLRRIKQHNAGREKGGAKRTNTKTLRPWEVTCIVHGFPSKIAALQFEWAWQHTHKSRHAKDDNDGMLTNLDFRVSPKSGKVRKKKPSTKARSLTDRITNLHILLRAPSFARWPLSIRFFATDVHRVFNAVNDKMDTRFRRDVSSTVDGNAIEHYDQAGSKPPTSAQTEPGNRLPLNGVEKLDFGYFGLKNHVTKSREVLASNDLKCAVCAKHMHREQDLAVICEHNHCKAASHLDCLSKHFLQHEATTSNPFMLPSRGTCPNCKSTSEWSTLTRELSLRTRGEKELATIFKKLRGRKAAVSTVKEGAEDEDVDMTIEEMEESEGDGFVALEEFEASVIEDDIKQPEDVGFTSLEDFEARPATISPFKRDIAPFATLEDVEKKIQTRKAQGLLRLPPELPTG